MSLKNKDDDPGSEWQWRYSGWTGIMYGPIPVGIIVVAIGLICYAVYSMAAN